MNHRTESLEDDLDVTVAHIRRLIRHRSRRQAERKALLRSLTVACQFCGSAKKAVFTKLALRGERWTRQDKSRRDLLETFLFAT